jgi:hypothetical protein
MDADGLAQQDENLGVFAHYQQHIFENIYVVFTIRTFIYL